MVYRSIILGFIISLFVIYETLRVPRSQTGVSLFLTDLVKAFMKIGFVSNEVKPFLVQEFLGKILV